jgi:hypothetical protein
VNDADFLSWLRDDRRKKVILAEMKFGYETGGAMTEGTVYLSNAPYVTAPTDSVPNRSYRDVIVRMGRFGSGIDVQTLGPDGRFQLGSLELAAGDGSIDFLLKLVYDGRDITFWLGDQDWPRGWFRQVLSGVVKSIAAPDESRIVVQVADRRLLLDAAVIAKVIATGPEAGRLAPRVYGAVYNLSLRIKDATSNEYIALQNYTASSYVTDVRDSGVSLGAVADAALFSGDNTAITANFTTELISYTGHGLAVNDVVQVSSTGTVFGGLTNGGRYWVISSGFTANDFKLSETRGGAAVDITGTAFSGTMSFKRFRYMDNTAVDGTIQLSTTAAGQVTADVWESSTGGYQPFALAQELIETWAPDVEIDADSFTNAEIALRARYDSKYTFCGLAIESRQNLLDVLAAILVPYGGWVAIDHDGVVRAGIMAPADIAGETATRTLTADQIDDQIQVENLPVQFGGASVGYALNSTTQADGLATSLTETQRALYIRPHRSRVSVGATFDAESSTYTGSWWAHHDGSRIAREITALHNGQSSLPVSKVGSEVARELVADQAPWRRVVSARVGLEAFDWLIGDVVELTYPRYGMDGGRNFRLAGKVVDLDAQTIDLVLLTQTTPDYTTSDYP